MMFDPGFSDRSFTVNLDGVTLEEALNQILQVNSLTYKVLSQRTILVYPDTQANRAKYEEQVVRIFYLSSADATELAQVLNQMVRAPNLAVQPLISPNKAANTITARASATTMALIERMIEANDKPRAEVVVEVEILEVNRERAKQYGLSLTQYAVGGIFSPEQSPSLTVVPGTPGTPGTGVGGGTPPEAVVSPPVFNLNTITQGISTADFYLAVPAAVVRFLESDSQTKLIAKPNLRGTEGQKLTLNLGEEIPVPSTAFTPIAGGGANVNPLTSFQYRKIGVNLELTPRVTLEGDILLELSVENSSRGADVTIAGTTAPSFGSRLVTTKLRLREGESTLLAGLLREDEVKSVRGFPGAIRLPLFKQLLSDNVNSVKQTDIVILLTPHVVRTSEVSQRDLDPIYVGTGLPGFTGPQFIAPQPEAPPPPAAPAAPPAFTSPTAPAGVPRPPQAAPAGVPPPSPTPPVPPGSSPIPGTTALPPPTTTTTTTTTTTVPPVTPPPTEPAPPPPPTTTTTTTTTAPPTAAPAATSAAQVMLTPPGTEFRVAAGPYTVPISIVNANRLSTITLTITYNQAALRVRSVQPGSFLGPVPGSASFTPRVDAEVGRIDIALTRLNDPTGMSGTGLLGAILFDAIAPGQAPFTISGVATAPGGVQLPLQFTPSTVTVR
jgi:general secretion pathway protein D